MTRARQALPAVCLPWGHVSALFDSSVRLDKREKTTMAPYPFIFGN